MSAGALRKRIKLKYKVLKGKRSLIARNERGRMGRTGNHPTIPVIPTQCKRECGVNEALGQFDVTTRYGQESNL
jgi:hypothetical protein